MYEGVHVNVYMHVRMYECTHVLQDYASWLDERQEVASVTNGCWPILL